MKCSKHKLHTTVVFSNLRFLATMICFMKKLSRFKTLKTRLKRLRSQARLFKEDKMAYDVFAVLKK
jgi:hypothetical protein